MTRPIPPGPHFGDGVDGDLSITPRDEEARRLLAQSTWRSRPFGPGADVYALDEDGKRLFWMHFNGETWRGKAAGDCVAVAVGAFRQDNSKILRDSVRLAKPRPMIAGDELIVSGLLTK